VLFWADVLAAERICNHCSRPGKAFDVFVDRPTGFTFVKMPARWKFVGAVSKEDAQHLPRNVLTAVLPLDTSREIATAWRK
jgi:hypothetical protein